MRILLTTLLVSFAFSNLFAQQAIIKFNSGDSTEVYITSVKEMTLFTADSTFSLENLESVSFQKEKGRDIHLYYELSDAGVKVEFDESLKFSPIDPTSVKVGRDPIYQLKESLKQYRKAHQYGAGLQLAGLLLSATGVFLDSDQLIAAGFVTIGGGLIYEISSARHLKNLE